MKTKLFLLLLAASMVAVNPMLADESQSAETSPVPEEIKPQLVSDTTQTKPFELRSKPDDRKVRPPRVILDEPLEANIATALKSANVETVTLLVVPKQGARVSDMNAVHRKHGGRVLTLTDIGYIQQVQIPKSSLAETKESLRDSGAFDSIEENFVLEARKEPADPYMKEASQTSSHPLMDGNLSEILIPPTGYNDPGFSYNSTNRWHWPNDPTYTRDTYQWCLTNSGATIHLWRNGVLQSSAPAGDVNASMHAIGPWNADGVVVAIIDTGCDMNHPDLQGSFWTNTIDDLGVNGISADDGGNLPHELVATNNVSETSSTRHGTGMAGLIAAIPNNNIGIAGVAPGAKLMICRTIHYSLGEIAYLVNYAVSHNAKVLVLAWGTSVNSPTLKQALAEAAAQDITIVCSALNSDTDYNVYANDYPICWKKTPWNRDGIELLAVTSLFPNGALFPGGAAYGSHWIDGMAPGGYQATLDTNSGVMFVNGTSFAAPNAAGCDAVLQKNYPHLTVAERIALLNRTANRGFEKGTNTLSGGYFNLDRAMASAFRLTMELDENQLPFIRVRDTLAGQTYAIEQSPDAVTWSIATEFSGQPDFTYYVPDPSAPPMFYRLKLTR